MEGFQLLASGVAVLLLVVIVGEIRRRTIRARKSARTSSKRDLAALVDFADEFLDGRVHHVSKRHLRVRASANVPHVLKHIFHRAALVGVDRRGAQLQGSGRGG